MKTIPLSISKLPFELLLPCVTKKNDIEGLQTAKINNYLSSKEYQSRGGQIN